MATVLKQKIHKSTKDRRCDSCNAMFNMYGLNELKEFPLTEYELKALDKAKENNYMIKKGEEYIYQVVIYDGFQTTCSIPDIFNIFIKYKLYDE